MSKQPPVGTPLGDDLPPPYYQTDSPAEAVATNSYASNGSQSSLFASHLSSLRSRIDTEQAARLSARDQRDSQTLALVVPHVEDLLSSIAAMHPPPRLVEASLVPNNAVDLGWLFTESDDKRLDEVRTVVRVEMDNKMEGDRKPSPEGNERPQSGRSPFDDWGRWEDEDSSLSSKSVLWWYDEDMARRLARHLQPDRPTASVDRQTVSAHIARKNEDGKANRWSLFKKAVPPEPVAPPKASRVRDRADDVTMTVTAEEVTFRRENEIGIWESRTGWGLVVRVRIKGT